MPIVLGIIKDQVTQMLFRTQLVSTRALFHTTVALFCLTGIMGSAAAQTAPPPLLVPYTITTVAGDPNYPSGLTSTVAGYYGEGVPATRKTATGNATTLNSPATAVVDSAGNIYIADSSNYIIREVNAQTGLITTVAGQIPQGCSGVNCSIKKFGCDDGVPAKGHLIGPATSGLAVDGWGNLYVLDGTQATVSIIYRGGTRVADFIKLENPTAVASAGGVLPGYVYHVAGTIDSSCNATLGNTDGALAFQNATFGKSPSRITLDGAGNIYVADNGNATIRVINTQETTQTFFQYQVQPGYMQSITNCNAALTIPCPSPVTATANNGINGPVNGIVFNSQYKAGNVDAYGNVYQLNGTGSGTLPPGIYAAIAYAGGAPLTNLLTAEKPLLDSYYTYPTPALQYGYSYVGIDNPASPGSLPGWYSDILANSPSSLNIRPSALAPDNFGTFWFSDNHYPYIMRIDQYTGLATGIIGSTSQRATANVAGIYSSPATFTNRWQCVYGSSSNPWTQGPTTYDPEGDQCPALVGRIGTNNTVISDSLGNIIMPDTQQLIRELNVGTQFPDTPVGTSTPVIQAIQVHFNVANPPHDIGAQIPDGPQMTGYQTSISTTNSVGTFGISPANSDFSIDTTTPEFPLGSLIVGANSNSGFSNTSTTANFKMYAGVPTCTQLGAAPNPTPVQDYDCLVYVKFNPTAPGLRVAQLVVTTTQGTYNFELTGTGVGGQLAVDGGTPSTIQFSGIGTTNSVAVDPAGNIYAADPDNSRILVIAAGTGTQAALPISGATLKNPKGVALDGANNIYIADTGNNRVLKVDANSHAATVLGNNVWIAGPGNDPPPQYAFKQPQGVAVDTWGNVYVADTGNKAVVEIPANITLGGAIRLLDYPGAPAFVNPVAVSVDPDGNIYVADTGNSSAQIVELGPGGGDMVNLPGTQFPNLKGQNLVTPNGVAVDAAGNVYASDSSQNAVFVFPAGTGAAATPYALNIPGLKTPAGLALDANGNLYIADSGNHHILFLNRNAPVLDFGTVPQNSNPVSTHALKVLNIGTQAVTLSSPFSTVLGSANNAFTLANNSCSGSPLVTGTACTLTATFNPTVNGSQSETLLLNATQTLQLTGIAISPQASVSLSASYSSGSSPAAGATATITATVTSTTHTPSGTVTFSYATDSNAPQADYASCSSSGTQTVTLSGAGTASFQLPTLVQGLSYKVSATFTPDAADTQDSGNDATPLVIQVPGIPVTATASSITFTYGQTPPAISGTISPALPSGVTATFTTAATAKTPIGTYPIQVFFKGTNNCAYGFPTVLTSSGAPATATENPAPLSYKIPNFTTTYGAAPISYGAQAVITGLVNNDPRPSATFVPPDSSILNVGTYTVTPTVTGATIGNYTVTAPPSTLVVTQAIPSVAAASPQTLVANTTSGVASAPFSIAVAPPGKGIPTGSITVLDNFTPITSGAPGTGTVVPACTIPFVGATTSGSATVSVSGNFGLATGQTVTGPGIPSGTTISAVSSGSITLSGNATATSPAVVLSAASGTSTCNALVQVTLDATGAATYKPTNTSAGIHQYSFIYNGDSNFTPAESAINVSASTCKPTSVLSQCLVVDAPDFALSSSTGVIQIIPGITPSGNGLPAAANQSAAAPESAVINISGFLSFGSSQPGFTVALSCTTQNPSYVSCSMTPPTVCVGNCPNTSGGFTTVNSTASVLAVSTPATLPLGFFSSSNVTTSTTRTVLAFVPFGVLAFCVRRRRRLSKVLWMLIGVAAIGAGMQGCGGNQVNFYTPVPTGPQTVTVTGTFTGGGTTPAETRSISVPINIQ